MTERFPKDPLSPQPPSLPGEGDTVVHADEQTIIRSDGAIEQQEKPEARQLGVHLLAFSGPLAGQTFPLQIPELGTFILGRGAECQLVLDDGSVSRRHAEIKRQGKFHFLSDLGSSNGTLVDEQLIDRDHLLRNEAQIKIGIYDFAFIDPSLTPADYPTALPVPFDPHAQARQAARALPLPPEPSVSATKVRPGFWGFWILLLAAAFLYFGVKKISQEEGGQIKTVWDNLFSGPKGPVLAYPLLEVRTAPVSGSIFFQGEFFGKSPVEKKLLDGVRPGVDLELRAEFFLPVLEEKLTVTKSVAFSRDQEIASFLLEAPVGLIHVKKLPANTQVLLEYLLPEATESKIKQPKIDYKEPILAPYGEYKFELRQDEKFRYRRKFNLSAAEPGRVFELNDDDLTFAPLSITSTPSEAEVYLDGELLNLKTPLENFRLPQGNHTIVLKKENYQDLLLEKLPNPVQVNEPLQFDVILPITQVGELIVRAKQEYDANMHKQMEATLYEALRKKPGPTPLEKAEIQYLLGQAYFLGKNYKQAIIGFRKAEEFTDTDGKRPFADQAKLGIARVYVQQGQKQGALRYAVEVFFAAQNLVVKSGAEEIFHKVSPVYSVIYLDTIPPGATIYLNGRKVQSSGNGGQKADARTPMIIPDLPVGAFNLLLTRQGYADHQEVVRLGTSDIKAVKVRLKPR